MTIEEVAVWFQQNILPLLEVALVIVTAYFAYRINKGRLKIEKLVGISEKANLAVKPKTQYHKKEIIVLPNVGTVPIDEIETSLDILISRKNSSDIQLKLEWESARAPLTSSLSSGLGIRFFPRFLLIKFHSQTSICFA